MIGGQSHPITSLKAFEEFYTEFGGHIKLWRGQFSLTALALAFNTVLWVVAASPSPSTSIMIYDIDPKKIEGEYKVPALPEGLPSSVNPQPGLFYHKSSHFKVLLTAQLVLDLNLSVETNPLTGLDLGTTTSCYICNKVFKQEGVLRRHKKSVHGISVPAPVKSLPPSTSCLDCGQILNSLNNLARHMRRVHGDCQPSASEVDKFGCKVCAFQCARKDVLVLHRRIHSKNLAPVACDQCTFQSKNPVEFDNHKRRKHVPSSSMLGEVHVCDHCGYEAGKVSIMRKHVQRSHPPGLDNPCALCSFSSRSLKMMRKHIEHSHASISGG